MSIEIALIYSDDKTVATRFDSIEEAIGWLDAIGPHEVDKLRLERAEMSEKLAALEGANGLLSNQSLRMNLELINLREENEQLRKQPQAIPTPR